MCFSEDEMKKKSCRGVVSHVGVVLSFVIFVTFIIFLYIIIRPAVDSENKQNLLDNIKDIIVENSSADLVSASVFIGDVPQNCVRLVGFLSKVEMGNRIIAINENGEVLTNEISGQDLYVRKNNDEKFLKIYGSEEFDVTENGTMPGCVSSYTLGLVRTEKIVFEKPIIQLIDNYNSDYESLKEELNIGSGNDFSLGFTYANGTSVSTQEREIIANVFINEFPVQYISESAAREPGSLSVGIW
jgi:hypothetical protein